MAATTTNATIAIARSRLGTGLGWRRASTTETGLNPGPVVCERLRPMRTQYVAPLPESCITPCSEWRAGHRALHEPHGHVSRDQRLAGHVVAERVVVGQVVRVAGVEVGGDLRGVGLLERVRHEAPPEALALVGGAHGEHPHVEVVVGRMRLLGDPLGRERARE